MPTAVATTSIAESLLAEFETQAPITRRFLERLPEDKLTWKPHERSLSAGQLAYHIASVPGGVARFVENNPAQAPAAFHFPHPATRTARCSESLRRAFGPCAMYCRGLMTQRWRRGGAWSPVRGRF